MYAQTYSYMVTDGSLTTGLSQPLVDTASGITPSQSQGTCTQGDDSPEIPKKKRQIDSPSGELL